MEKCPACGDVIAGPRFAASDRLYGLPGCFTVAVCDTCGSGRTLPEVQDAELEAYYPTSYAPYEPAERPIERALSSLIRRWQGYRGLRRRPLSVLSDAPLTRALDVGCGRGDLATYLASKGWDMVGVEPSNQAAAAARDQGLSVLTGVLATVDIPDRSFGAVVFQQSLEHTNEPLEDLRRTWAALMPGGIVSVAVPNFGGRQARRFSANWFHLDVPRHRTHLTPAGLSTLLKRAGFTDIAVSTSTTPVGLPASIQYRLAGRCLFPDGLRLRLAAGFSVLALPIALTFDIGRLEGDVLEATARRPSDR
jgi:SAM-dependent methyltransferase